MKNEEILKKAIEKAIENGFKYSPMMFSDGVHKVVNEIDEMIIYYNIIFSHDFAQAFWKGNPHDFAIGEDETIGKTLLPYWQHHLQQMVICEDKFKYLERFLKK